MQSPGESQLWCPGQSLWSLITEHVTGSELPKVHTALGSSLVDVYTEVHAEAATWHMMWREGRRGSGSSGGGTPLPRRQASPLADPPAVKELVRAEVKMLLQTLRERSSREGRAVEELRIRYRPETVDYVLGRPDSSCRSAADAHGGSRPGSHCSVRSNADDEIEAVRDQLNASDIDQVAERLRSVLTEECEALTRLVKHFKGNIKQKLQSPREVDKSEPSLAELRELRGAIQVDLELYPAPSPLCLRELKNSFRLPAAQRVSDETLRALSSTSAFRPRPPPPPHPPPPPPPALGRPAPRPPPGAPPSEASASLKAVSRVPGERRSTSASTGRRKIKAPPCDRVAASAPASRHSAAPPAGPENSRALHETHPSPLAGRDVGSVPSFPRCEAGSSGGSSRDSTERPASATGRSGTQNGRRRGSFSASTTVQADLDRSDRVAGGGHRQSPEGTRSHPAAVPVNGRFFTAPRKALESITGQAKGVQEAELEFVSQRHRPVPPARVTT
nr:coiled-coil domain-containing protein 24 isoform X1 [Gasterosteus aculeatus aculeatus]